MNWNKGRSMNKWPLCKFNRNILYLCVYSVDINGWIYYLEGDKTEQSEIKYANVYTSHKHTQYSAQPANLFALIVSLCFYFCSVSYVLTLADLCNPNAKIIWLIVSATECILSANILCEPVTSHTINFSRKIVQLLQNIYVKININARENEENYSKQKWSCDNCIVSTNHTTHVQNLI